MQQEQQLQNVTPTLRLIPQNRLLLPGLPYLATVLVTGKTLITNLLYRFSLLLLKFSSAECIISARNRPFVLYSNPYIYELFLPPKIGVNQYHIPAY